MLLGARIYLQPTTNLNAHLWDKNIVFQTTQKKITQKKIFLKKGEKIWRKSWRKIMILNTIILIRLGMELLKKNPFFLQSLFSSSSSFWVAWVSLKLFELIINILAW
jgi:hypothetical protein